MKPNMKMAAWALIALAVMPTVAADATPPVAPCVPETRYSQGNWTALEVAGRPALATSFSAKVKSCGVPSQPEARVSGSFDIHCTLTITTTTVDNGWGVYLLLFYYYHSDVTVTVTSDVSCHGSFNSTVVFSGGTIGDMIGDQKVHPPQFSNNAVNLALSSQQDRGTCSYFEPLRDSCPSSVVAAADWEKAGIKGEVNSVKACFDVDWTLRSGINPLLGSAADSSEVCSGPLDLNPAPATLLSHL